MAKPLEARQESLARLESLEKIVGACLVPMIKGWAALGEILKDKLWKAAGYEKEKDYLEKRWGELSRSGFFHNKRIAYVAAAIGADNLPDGTRPAHLACLVNFEPAMQQEIWERAKQTAPDGEMTATHVEKTAHLVQDERNAAIKEQSQAEKSRAAAAAAAAAAVAEEDDDEGESDGSEADSSSGNSDSDSDAASPVKASAPRPGPVKRAMAHPIIDQDRVDKLEKQGERTVRKLERIALALNCTPQDLLEKYGSDAA